jgi:tripartite-type tricarboxylate transporter receptor subunit TctC
MVTINVGRAAVGARRLGVALAGAGLAVAQEAYPTRPIEFIVPWGLGGGADRVARKPVSR